MIDPVNVQTSGKRNLFWRVLLVVCLLLLAWRIYDWVWGAPDAYRFEHLRDLAVPVALVLLAWGQLVRNVVIKYVLVGLVFCVIMSSLWVRGDWTGALIATSIAVTVGALIWIAMRTLTRE